MFKFRNISIKNKLVATQVLISVIVLGLCFAAFVVSEIRGYKQRKVKSVFAIAQVISTSSSSSLYFMDNAAAKKILSELSVENDIDHAVILDKKGNVFASYTREGVDTFAFTVLPANGPHFEYEGGYLFVNNEIIKDKEKLGTICIRVDLAPLNEIIKQESEILLVLLVLGLGLSFLITLFVQSYITKPLLYLVKVMQSIIGSKDYKSRAVVKGRDEISILSGAFNNMLDQIEKRDNEMERRVKERTAELESANKELESFSYSVSHDMRAPLRAVSGFAKIVSQHYAGMMDDAGKDALNIINNEAARMGQLIDDLLAFSRLGKNEIQKFKVDMNTVANSAMKEVLNAEKRKNVADITIDYLPDAYCDGVLIRQVFVNLFSNAIKYSEHNPKPVIHAGAYSENGSTVYYVEDNGAGFDMRFYHKLFGVFQRLHAMPDFKGTGIGLAIVKKIVERHGGRVWAEGKVNIGAKFYFSLPNK